MKNLMTTTALVIATAMPVAAKEMNDGNVFMKYSDGEMTSADMLASNLIGMRVYTSDTEVTDKRVTEANVDWDDIGEVSDVVMSREGETESILLDIGGFLGIGEKTVAVNFDELRFIPDGTDQGDFFIVFEASQEMLEQAEPFNFEQIGAWTSQKWSEVKANTSDAMESLQKSASNTAEDVKAATADTAHDVKETAQATADGIEHSTEKAAAAAMTTARGLANDIEQTADLTAPDIERDGYEPIAENELTSEALTGAPVYDTRDEWIGEVSELILDEQGQVEKAVLDVGGFLGIGEKPVATDLDSLTIKRATDDGDLRVYVDASKEELEQMPTYNES